VHVQCQKSTGRGPLRYWSRDCTEARNHPPGSAGNRPSQALDEHGSHVAQLPHRHSRGTSSPHQRTLGAPLYRGLSVYSADRGRSRRRPTPIPQLFGVDPASRGLSGTRGQTCAIRNPPPGTRAASPRHPLSVRRPQLSIHPAPGEVRRGTADGKADLPISRTSSRRDRRRLRPVGRDALGG